MKIIIKLFLLIGVLILFWKTIYEDYNLQTTMNTLENLKSIINFEFIK